MNQIDLLELKNTTWPHVRTDDDSVCFFSVNVISANSTATTSNDDANTGGGKSRLRPTTMI